MNAIEKITALRDDLAARGLDGFIVPRTDAYQGEYVQAADERLAWLTGFTGSAGAAVILADKAMAMSDGRYTLQLKSQVDASVFALEDSQSTSPQAWAKNNLPEGARIGYDPRLHTAAQVAEMKKTLRAKKIELVPVDFNPVDAVWKNRPAVLESKVEIFPDTVAGRTATEKRDLVVAKIIEEGGHAVILPLPESVAWLLNIRGTDIPHNPFALSRAIVYADGSVDWFISSSRLSPAVRTHIGNHVRVRDPAEMEQALADIAAASKAAGKPVLVDDNRAPVWFKMKLKDAGAEVESVEDPCLMPRACKTPAEQKSIIAAHVRDGVAVTRFLKWLDDEAPRGCLTELDIDTKLKEFRSLDPAFRDTSFDTIAGWAGNGAIVHYRATPEKYAKINPPGILLIDSGAQYNDGTTDITRTVTIGTPTDEQKKMYTLVLRGHIAASTARVPEGTNGAQVDAMARQPLWDADDGYDFDHGTGHGVGCYLSVHEEAASISKKSTGVFKPGMLISNEPGYYKENAFGIRIENLILVREDGMASDGRRRMLAFDTVTLAPHDRRLIVPEMMSDAELEWLNAYHDRVYRELSPHLDSAEKQWLRQATQPLKKNLSGPGQNKTPDIKPGVS